MLSDNNRSCQMCLPLCSVVNDMSARVNETIFSFQMTNETIFVQLELMFPRTSWLSWQITMSHIIWSNANVGLCGTDDDDHHHHGTLYPMPAVNVISSCLVFCSFALWSCWMSYISLSLKRHTVRPQSDPYCTQIWKTLFWCNKFRSDFLFITLSGNKVELQSRSNTAGAFEDEIIAFED